MKVEQIYTGCLAQGAYYITSNNEAAIIDPLRETQPYLDRLNEDGVSLKYIFETHFHADFVSGHLDLAKKTGAAIVYGPTAKPGFEATVAEDGEIFELGGVQFKVIHTPGHTLESSCFLLIDETGKDHSLFSGDTLFLGDVGRPDLAQKAANMTQEELAGLLYHSLYEKIIPLADDVIVYPAHGAGSACGKNMSKETVDTLGNQKKVNYALNQPDEETFIKVVTDGLLPPPGYFGMNVAMNKQGYESFDEVMSEGKTSLTPNDLEKAIRESEVLVLDTRTSEEFAQGHIPNALNIGLEGDFAPWVGAVIVDVEQPIALVVEEDRVEEAITRLSRVGFDHVVGYLTGGMDAWIEADKEVSTVKRIDANTFAKLFKAGEDTVIDVRKESEYDAEHVEDAVNKPLAYINEWVSTTNNQQHFYLHCAGGYRSMIAASKLKANGINNFTEISGGFNEIATTSVPKTAFVCQSKN